MLGRTISHDRIISQLGSGGMGVVYAAEDTCLRRSVALKFVSGDLALDARFDGIGRYVINAERLNPQEFHALDHNGVRDRITPLVGLEYSF